MTAQTFGQWMERERVGRDESRADLGSALGVGESHVWRVEKDQRSLSDTAIRRLATHWGLGEIEEAQALMLRSRTVASSGSGGEPDSPSPAATKLTDPGCQTQAVEV